MITITEGLQEIKTLLKRIEKKRLFVRGYLWRQSHLCDPHEKNGGSQVLVKSERQAIEDLENNIIDIRRRIIEANNKTTINICGETKSITEWLIWRRELSSEKRMFLDAMAGSIQSARKEAAKNGLQVVDSAAKAGSHDIIVNVDEKAVADEIETLAEMLSTLDGQLSLKNSTTQI